MKTAFEISMYPLREEYEEPILTFLDELKKSGLLVKINGMSTQVFGEYDEVSAVVMKAIKNTFEAPVKASFVLKVLPNPLDPDFSL